MPPFVPTKVTELIPTSASHMNASCRFLDDVLAVVALAIMQCSLKKLKVLIVTVSFVISE
jgi:hypothetical protein